MHPEDRERFFNRWWRLEHLYKIQTKDAGEKITLKFNPVQQQIARYLGHGLLLLILKARQEGVSTFCLLYHLDLTLFTPNYTSVILAHRWDSLKKVVRIIKVAYESCRTASSSPKAASGRRPRRSTTTSTSCTSKT